MLSIKFICPEYLKFIFSCHKAKYIFSERSWCFFCFICPCLYLKFIWKWECQGGNQLPHNWFHLSFFAFLTLYWDIIRPNGKVSIVQKESTGSRGFLLEWQQRVLNAVELRQLLVHMANQQQLWSNGNIWSGPQMDWCLQRSPACRSSLLS